MYGSTMNWSMTENDGKYELGLSYKDSSGVDVNHHLMADDLSSLVHQAINGFQHEYLTQRKQLAKKAEEEKKAAEQAEKEELNNNSKSVEDNKNKKDNYTLKLEQIIQQLQKENQSLKIDNEVLQRRTEKMMNEREEASQKSKYQDAFDLEELLQYFL